MINSIATYKIFADFYDFYTGKFNSDFNFYQSYSKKSDKIIEIGCGTGRILNYFLQKDYYMTGVDVSPEMLDKAEIKLKKWIRAGKLTLINHDFTLNCLKNRFDKALLTFYTFNYIIEEPVEFLRNIYDSLSNQGLILLDLFYPNSLFDKTIDNKWIEKKIISEGQEIKIMDNRRLIKKIEHRQQIFFIRDQEIKVDTDRKYYSPIELKEHLKTAGFTDILFSLDYDLAGFKNEIDENKLYQNYIVIGKKTAS
jgi:SAM-dependent methyltransferase